MKPVLCNYYVTYRCNASCSFCDIWEQPSPLVTLADVETNIAALKRLGVRVIDFTGGEPLLHPELDKMLAVAKDAGMITTVTTNGLLYPKRAESLRGLIDMLHFSIDAADPIRHDLSRNVKCFDKVMESIEIALSLGENPDLLFTVSNDNWKELDKIYTKISHPNKLVLIINPLFDYHGIGDRLGTEVMQHVRSFAKKSYTYLNPAFMTLRERGGNDIEDPVCKAVSSCIVISPFNEVVLPCYHGGRDRVAIDGKLEEIWGSDLVKQHVEMQGRHEVCNGCTVNCYFEPSFAVTPGGRYFWESLPSKTQYLWTKFVVQKARTKLGKERTAHLPSFPRTSGDGHGSSVAPQEMISLPTISRSSARRGQ